MVFVSSLGFPNPGSSVKISKIQHMAHPPIDIPALSNAVNPANGFHLPVTFGQVGPKLVEAGVIDISNLQQMYQKNGQTLSDLELNPLIRGSQDAVIINRQNASFLFRFFWALGLTNQNSILDHGPIQQAYSNRMEDVSSISGWKLSKKPPVEIYSKVKILTLSPAQQARVEEAAKSIYLPCCDNNVALPDCSHSMAMLGLLELMGAQDASAETMFTTAKQVSAFWFPQQTLEQGLFFIATQLKDYADVDGRTILNATYSSAKGFQQLHQWLAENGMLNDDAIKPIACSEP
jgi:hypothetical protein